MNYQQKVLQYWNAFNKHDVDEILSLLDDNVLFFVPSNPQGLKGKNYLRVFWNTVFHTAIPNMHEEVKSPFEDGDTVACEVIETGTLSGKLQYPGEILPIEVLPTHQSYKMRVAVFFKFASSGFISEIRAYWDLASFLHQTGIEYSKLTYALKRISEAQSQL